MSNREQVMYAIERCTSHEPDVCGQCPYFGDGDAIRCMEVLMKKALKLLKEQTDIVRCNNCIYHHYDSSHIPYCELIDYGYGWKDDDFCSRGKRK